VSTSGGSEQITMYWRPGCPWCARLRRGLRRARIATVERNIWEDAAAAATVRRLAGGNETVPTVVVGEVALVNPSLAAVRKALAEPVDDPAQAPPSGPARLMGSHGAPTSSNQPARVRGVLRRLLKNPDS